MTQPSDLTAGKAAPKLPGKAGRSSFGTEAARLRLVLADQIEKNQMREARETVLAILCLNPGDADALNARDLIEEQLAAAITHPVGEIRRLLGHQSPVNGVAFSPDGTRALTCSGTPSGSGVFRTRMDYSVRLWDVEGGQEIRKFLGPTSMISCVAFAADGKRALSGGQDGGISVWDVETGQSLHKVGKRLPLVYAALFSADGTRIFTASVDRAVRVWDIESGERVNRFDGHHGAVTSLALSASGRLLLTGCMDGAVRLYQADTGQLVRRFDGHKQGVLSVALSADGRRILSGGEDRTVRLWNLDTGEQLKLLMGHTYNVTNVAFPSDARYVVSTGDNTLRVWDVESGREVRSLEGHTDVVLGLALSPDGERALTASRDTTVRYWQLPSERVSTLSSTAADNLEDIQQYPVPQWVDMIRSARLLEPAHEKELVENIATRMRSPVELLRHLLQRGWLTGYQLHQLAAQQGLELRLGNYVLLKPLGAGGMGQVFRARRFGTTDEVALKIVLPEMTRNAVAVKQFMWEIQALSRMNHPNIIRTYDAGAERGRHFFTMEYIEGTDLAHLVRKYGPLPVHTACSYVRQAALGLEHAHEHCLIHRDIKPANLLLTLPKGQQYQPGSSGDSGIHGPTAAVIKVLDWGLAGLRPPTTTKDATKSSREESTGTVDYMSPEQAMDMSSTDIRADIYSLGCTLYHLLTGKAPFHGFNYVMKLHKHQTAEPPAISTFRADVPPALEEVIRKMMSKKAADRYRAPALVASELSPFCKKPGK